MRKRPGDAGLEAGFSLVELLVVVSIIVIITAIAIGQYAGARTQRVRHEATASLPGLKAWEEAWYERTGSYRFSATGAYATDRIRFLTASTNDCRGPYQSTTPTDLSFVAYPSEKNTTAFIPQGCQFEYYVIPDRCDANCADTGDAADACNTASPVRCFCAIAVGTGTVAKNDRFCIDDLGRQFASVTGMKDWN